jgi:hypothetical protein
MSVDSTAEEIETEDGLNPDHPLVKLFRKLSLETAAKKQGSSLYCPRCDTNLPYTQMTVQQEHAGVDANNNPVKKIVHYCSLCEKYF